MRKIPTVFTRDASRRYVTDEVTPGCEWVLAGEGTATRKYDGTCVRLDEAGAWWARREVKPGKFPPLAWREVDHDEITGKRVGWEPIGQSSFAKFHAEALRQVDALSPTGDTIPPVFEPGTYELCGPKVNGNPEKYETHRLIRHANAEVLDYTLTNDGSFEGLTSIVRDMAAVGWEGLVWHHPDGRMAKLKARDCPPEVS